MYCGLLSASIENSHTNVRTMELPGPSNQLAKYGLMTASASSLLITPWRISGYGRKGLVPVDYFVVIGVIGTQAHVGHDDDCRRSSATCP